MGNAVSYTTYDDFTKDNCLPDFLKKYVTHIDIFDIYLKWKCINIDY